MSDTTPFFTARTWVEESASLDKREAIESYRQTMTLFERTFGLPQTRLRLAYGPDVMTLDGSTHYVDGVTGVHYAYRRLLKCWEIEKEDAQIGKAPDQQDCYCCCIT